MLNSRLVSQFLIILIAAIVSIVVALNHQHGNFERSYSARSPNIIQSIPAEPTEPVPLSPSVEVRAVTTETATTYKTTEAFQQYQPKYYQAAIHSNNYGDRYSVDVNGNIVDNSPIVVLHETTNSLRSAINTFRTPNASDLHQVSYHALIALDGTIIYLVPSEKRAFGAGNSVFVSSQGTETVKTNPNLPSSVNNFAYHISLETPVDGYGQPNQSYHSGYTDNQYKSLAWLLALSNIPDERITTHKDVDRSGQRFDPRSFDFDKFFATLHTYRQPASDNLETSTK